MEKWKDGTEMLKDGTVVGSRLSKKIQNFQSQCDLQHLCAEKLSNSLNYKTKCDHQHLCAEELINSLNYAIDNLPTYTILQQFTFGNNILIDESQDWVENMYSIYEGFAWYISRKLIPQGTSVFEFLDNPENGKKDNSWIKDRNEPPSYAIHLKFNHTPALQQKITDILIQIRADITAYQSVQAKDVETPIKGDYHIFDTEVKKVLKKHFTGKIISFSTILRKEHPSPTGWGM